MSNLIVLLKTLLKCSIDKTSLSNSQVVGKTLYCYINRWPFEKVHWYKSLLLLLVNRTIVWTIPNYKLTLKHKLVQTAYDCYLSKRKKKKWKHYVIIILWLTCRNVHQEDGYTLMAYRFSMTKPKKKTPSNVSTLQATCNAKPTLLLEVKLF